MVPIIFTVILFVAIIFSVSVQVKKRRKAGVTGIRSALTPIFMCLIAVTNILAYWFNFMGVLSWSMTIILLILGAYFTKYMPISNK